MAISILAAMALLAAATFRDYGPGPDDVTHAHYGDRPLKLYGSGFADAREGEIYACVYDRQGAPTLNLMTEPPP